MGKVELENKLTKYQNELIALNKRRRYLKDIIKYVCDKLDNMKEPIVNSRTENSKLISRDLNIVFDFLIKEKREITSSEIYKYLNEKLEGEKVRWKQGYLDGNIFMTAVGKYMKNSKNIRYEKRGQLTYWSVTSNLVNK